MRDTSDSNAAERELEGATRAVSDLEACLGLGRAWARWPALELERAANRLAETLPALPLDGGTQQQVEAQWHELASRRAPEDLGALLATPWPPTPAAASARLAKLAAFAPDPRIPAALIDLDTGERYLSGPGMEFWLHAWELMLHWGSVEARERMPSRPPSSSEPPWAHARWSATFQPLSTRPFDEAPQLTEKMKAALQHLDRRIGDARRDVDQLFDGVLEDPDSDALRLVLADALVDRGDIRGEFIQLQFAYGRGELTYGRRERMARLLRGAGRRWFHGLLGEVTSVAVFRRGLPAEVQLATRAPTFEGRCWRLVEGLSAASLAVPLADLLKDRVPRLRRVVDLRPETFVHLVRGSAGRRFELLEVRGIPPQPLTISCEIETLRIRAEAEDAVRWFLAAVPSGVVRLEVDVANALARVVRLLEPLAATSVRTLVLTRSPESWPTAWSGAWTATLTRESGPFTTLEVVLATGERPVELAELIGVFQARCTVRTTARLSVSVRTSLEQWFAEHGVSAELRRPMEAPLRPVVFEGR